MKPLSPFGRCINSLIKSEFDNKNFIIVCGITEETLEKWLFSEIDMPSETELEALATITKMSVNKVQALITASNESMSELNEAFKHPIKQ